MHGTTFFVRRVVSQATQSTSRIPHLNAHISQRSASRVPSPKKQSQPACHQRFQTTFAHPGSVGSSTAVQEVRSGPYINQRSSKQEDKHVSHTSNERTSSTVVNEQSSNAPINVYTILNAGEPDQLLIALLDDDLGPPFLRDASDENFDRALLLLDPDHFIKPFQEASRRLYYFGLDSQQQERSVRGIYERGALYIKQLDQFIKVRHDAGKRLTLQTCRHMLKWAAHLGNEQFANYILRGVMWQDEVRPDIDCYNYFLQATVWNHLLSLDEKFNMRVISRNLALRATRKAPKSLSGYKVANQREQMTGIRADVLKLFKQLIQKDLIANGSTFINLMVAMAREGDVAGVKSILKSVWNVDLDMLQKYDEDEIESPTFYELDSPLRPTNDLLFGVAHIFAINNDVNAAWLLVDFISRNYDLQIPREVWHHLLEWSMVLGIERTPLQKEKGHGDGQINPNFFEELYSVMIDQPHNIQPDAHMLYLRARNTRSQKLLDKEIAVIQELVEALEEQRARFDNQTRRIEVYLESRRPSNIEIIWGDQAFFEIRRSFLKESYHFEVQYQLLQRAITNLFTFTKWAGEENWQRQGIPQAVQRFAEYLPDTLSYGIKTGHVELACTELKAYAQATRTGSQLRNMRYIRASLETDHYDLLLERVRHLQKYLPCQLCDTLDHYTPDCPHTSPQITTLENFGKTVPEVVAGSLS